MKSPFKLTVTDKHQGACEICHKPGAVYESRFENRFTATLCIKCLDSQIDHRKEKEAVELPSSQSK